ncbi:hypothetical protein [Candidatus Uabimicrobium amorphum]|nr:hypothetical protein [Candidatus Uabimicrobium amorphum]
MDNKAYFFAMICIICICVGVILNQQSANNNSSTGGNGTITSLGSEEFNVQDHLVPGKYTIFKFGAQW